ncbi:MAG TPA: PEP/pyruvate-binding domain-containing protein [Vicinamibacterales bacterium]|nr:PEP/pyruvate-binding domain-containing protein [Vicinamibacterales bacterium]
MAYDSAASPDVPPFQRRFFGAPEPFTRIGDGPVGGKAAGLLFMRGVLGALAPPGRVQFTIPTLTVLTTEVFERFVQQNGLAELGASEMPDDRIALAFQRGDLPADLVGDLRALIEQVHTPLAVRSSSLYEDALARPFAGVYATKMIPNNQPDADSRFRRLLEAIKFVYASTYFADARAYRQAVGCPDADRMAVVIQEVVGRRHGPRFYPDVSGVARSFSFYRAARARPEDGVVSLALGLGRTIVDDGVAWSFSPRFPAAPPPVSSPRELAEVTQMTFWAVNMGQPPEHDPIRETEYLLRATLADAEADGPLRYVASTWDASRDRLTPGVGTRGPRVVDFAPLLALREWPLNEAVTTLLRGAERAVGQPVEIEFALTIDERADLVRIGFLQVRPMMAADEQIDLPEADLERVDALVASDMVLGNGTLEGLRDVVYVRPDRFAPGQSRAAGAEIARRNLAAVQDGSPYVLIGFGRWGTADPWLGIPLPWAQVAGARVIVEATLGGYSVEMSQGSHFFHNIASAGVSYFSVSPPRGRIDWGWLEGRPAVYEGDFVRHVRLDSPLRVLVDGRSGRGVIIR